MKHMITVWAVVALTMGLLSGCAYTTQVDNSAGRSSKYVDVQRVSKTEHTGIEAQDIVQLCDKMMRSMMGEPMLANAVRPPHVLIDSHGFLNESSDTVNLNMITDRLKIGLRRAARGRIRFVGRHAVAMIAKEKQLKAQGVVGQGTTAYSKTTLGVDYRLTGRITTHTTVSNQSGLVDNTTQIVLMMIDMQTGEEVWSDLFDFRKEAADSKEWR